MNAQTAIQFLTVIAQNIIAVSPHMEGDTLYFGESPVARYSEEKETWRLYNANGISVGYNSFDDMLAHILKAAEFYQ